MTAALLIVAFLLTGSFGDWIMSRVDRFLNEYVKEADQYDDTTMLCLKYSGAQQTEA